MATNDGKDDQAGSSYTTHDEFKECAISTEAEEILNTSNDETIRNEFIPSKNQMKKIAKAQKWEARKATKRLIERTKKKEKRKLLMEAGKAGISDGNMRKRLKKNTMAESLCKVKVAVDCSFDDLMNEKDISRTVSQLQYCYSANRRAKNPLQLHFTGVAGATKKCFDDIGVCKNWDVHFHADNIIDVFDKEDMIYLTSDSDNVLTELDTSKAYIIGGLVDHNSYKGLCHKLAVERGLSHAQLPISEFIKLKSRKVLAINHVFEILLHYTETNSWEDAFYKVIPRRKIMDTVKDSSIDTNITSSVESSCEIEGDQTNTRLIFTNVGVRSPKFCEGN